jgi:ketosteroid isomerase-like protein/predicted enzyme related to lactoylglutathione lyase
LAAVGAGAVLPAREAAVPASPLAVAPAVAPMAPPRAHHGHVALDPAAVRFVGPGAAADRNAAVEAILQLLESWCALDAAAYRGWLDPDVTRLSAVTGRLRGPEAVVAALPREWEAWERPGGEIAVDLAVVDAEVELAGDTATALYTVEVAGQESVRWAFDDRWLVYQVFRRGGDDRFRLLHQTLATDLDTPGTRPGFDFEFAVPVRDLARAVAFYVPLLGEPDAVGPTRAQFTSGASRFVLDAEGLGGRAVPRPGLPSGYGTLLVPDITAFAVELETPVTVVGGDRMAVVRDPSGNPFVVREQHFEQSGAPPEGPQAASELPAAAQAALAAWLHADAAGLAAQQASDADWFDNRRSNDGGVARGAAAIRDRVTADWLGYDRSPAGLSARLTVSDVAVVELGGRQLVSYRATLEGRGAHAFRDRVLVTQMVTAGRVAMTFGVRVLPEALVRELDYSAYPAADLRASERFFRRVMRLGKPYTDEGWFGFWGAHAVFGIFSADRKVDGIPVPGSANAYPSFWVASLRQTHAYLAAHGASFPVIPAINSRAGVDREPGYKQLAATDPAGNVLVFTEYTGR